MHKYCLDYICAQAECLHMHTWQPRSRIQARTSSARAAFWPRMHAFSSVLKVTLVGSRPPAISSLYLNQEHNGLILPFYFGCFCEEPRKNNPFELRP